MLASWQCVCVCVHMCTHAHNVCFTISAFELRGFMEHGIKIMLLEDTPLFIFLQAAKNIVYVQA
jgi:hypothetical protein